MDMSRRRNYPLSGGPYRWINTFDTAWQASPMVTDPPDIFDGFPWNPTWVHEENAAEKARRLGIRPKTKSSCGSFWGCLKELFSTLRGILRKLWPMHLIYITFFSCYRTQRWQRGRRGFCKLGSWHPSLYFSKNVEGLWVLGPSNCKSSACS